MLNMVMIKMWILQTCAKDDFHSFDLAYSPDLVLDCV